MITLIKKYKNNIMKQSLYDWLKKFNPTYFLTVHFPVNMRSEDYNTSQETLKKVMKRFQKSLIGSNWNKKSLPFIAIAETGIGVSYHYHILIYDCNYTLEQLKLALDDTVYKLSLTPETFKLEQVYGTVECLCFYTGKEIDVLNAINIDSDKIIPHSALFNLPDKQP